MDSGEVSKAKLDVTCKTEGRVRETPSCSLLNASVRYGAMKRSGGKVKSVVLDALHFRCLGDFQVQMLKRKLDVWV